MYTNKTNEIEFDNDEYIVMSRFMIESANYRSLSYTSKYLMILMQMQWCDNKYVRYGVREAAKGIRCSNGTACNAFNELQSKGFIRCVDESVINTGSKARDWQLTWMPFGDDDPTNDWLKTGKTKSLKARMGKV